MNILVPVVCFVGFLVPIFAEPTPEQKEAAKKIIMECKEKTGAADADLQTIKQHQIPTTKEGLCLLGCVFKKAGIIQDGKYSKDGMIAAFSPMLATDPVKLENMKNLAEKCSSEIGTGDTDPCITAKMLAECIVKNADEHGVQLPKPQV